jgi:hypothetical protein
MRQSNTFIRSALVLILALSLAQTGLAEDNPEAPYQKHLAKIRRLLPRHSALPPLLDLAQQSTNSNGAGRAWERRFTGSMLPREISDQGTAPPVGLGSITTSTVEFSTPIWALPARSCPVIVIAKAVRSSAHLASTHRLVYSTFTLEILEVIKTENRHVIQRGARMRAAQFGGTIRFPSGHVETFLRAGEGFLGLEKSYVLFLWRPIESDEVYMIAEPYLIEDDTVFPVKTLADVSAYENGVPLKDFEAKVKNAIQRKIDSN